MVTNRGDEQKSFYEYCFFWLRVELVLTISFLPFLFEIDFKYVWCSLLLLISSDGTAFYYFEDLLFAKK